LPDRCHDVLVHATVSVLGWIQTIEIVGFALVVLRLRSTARDLTHNWLAAAFGTLGAVVLAGHVLPQHPHGIAEGIAQRVLIAAIVAYPYLLYRFALTMRTPNLNLLRINTIATIAVIVWALALPHIPQAGQPRSVGFEVFVVAVLTLWTSLTVLMAIRLWRSGRSEPTVARRRMRTLAIAAVILDVALLGAGSVNSASVDAVQVIIDALVVLVIPLFYIGIAPPAAVVNLWRNGEQQSMRDATIALLQASSPTEVCDGLLPCVASFLGARGAVIINVAGEVVGSYDVDEAELASLRDDVTHRERGVDFYLIDRVMWLPMTLGWLLLVETELNRFFGESELRAIRSITTLADLALSRVMFMERERDRVETMRDFVAIASHELRTPTATVAGYASLLTKQWDAMAEGNKKQAVEGIRRQSVHLTRLVEDLLTVSRIESETVPSRPVWVNVRSCVDAVVSELDAAHVEVIVPADLMIYMDADHLRRVLTNYLRNAAIYGEPPVRIEADRADDRVQVCVVDYGPGVPGTFASRLFERFARADRKMSNAVGGTGLGLSIVRGLVEAAGGTAWYRPNDPRGSVFGISVPDRVVIPQQGAKEAEWTSAGSSSSSRTRSTSAG
jgi:signal transduction histidine kinase